MLPVLRSPELWLGVDNSWDLDIVHDVHWCSMIFLSSNTIIFLAYQKGSSSKTTTCKEGLSRLEIDRFKWNTGLSIPKCEFPFINLGEVNLTTTSNPEKGWFRAWNYVSIPHGLHHVAFYIFSKLIGLVGYVTVNLSSSNSRRILIQSVTWLARKSPIHFWLPERKVNSGDQPYVWGNQNDMSWNHQLDDCISYHNVLDQPAANSLTTNGGSVANPIMA